MPTATSDRRVLKRLRRRAALQYLWASIKVVLLYADTTAIRTFSAVGAFGWVLGMFLPLHTFERQGFEWMRTVAPAWLWGTLFLAHMVGAMWLVLYPLQKPDDPESEPLKRRVGSFSNALGFVLWLSVSSLYTLSVREFPPTMSLEYALSVAMFIVWIRGGRNPYKARL